MEKLAQQKLMEQLNDKFNEDRGSQDQIEAVESAQPGYILMKSMKFIEGKGMCMV